MTMIVNMLLDRMTEELTKVMKTEVSSAQLSRAILVKKGLLQESKIVNYVAIGITGGNHEDPKYMDGIATLDDFKRIGYSIPAREIGGGQIWQRRGVINVECFYVAKQLSEIEAHEEAYEVLGKLTSAVENIRVYDLTDSFGEHAINLFAYGSTFFESGGPPASYIFRGKVFWTCFTER